MTTQARFILARAAAILVTAYKTQIAEYQQVMPLALGVAPDAPNTYSELRAEADAGKLRVSTEFNSTSIYGAAGNLTFRIMHDYGHLLYDALFTTEEEVSLAKTQWLDIKRHIPAEWLDICHVVYFADTVEQSRYESLHGRFPVDQKGFVLAFLTNHFEKQA